YGAVILAVVLVLSLFRAMEPVVLRPSILLFVLAGAYLATTRWTLSDFSAARVALPATAVLLLLSIGARYLPISHPELAAELPNLTARASLVFLIMWVAGGLAARSNVDEFGWIRSLLFLTFLSHSIVSQVLGEVIQRLPIDLMDPIYMVFYFGSIATFILVGWVLTKIVPLLPGWAQLALSGRQRRVAK
ncbi:MAG: hypothetical protein AAFV27_13480, partial [Pseudomonadota bacterium]